MCPARRRQQPTRVWMMALCLIAAAVTAVAVPASAPSCSGNQSALIFAYWTAVEWRGLHLAASCDGLTYTALNGGRPILNATCGTMRDVYVHRGPDGKTFHLVSTGSCCPAGFNYWNTTDFRRFEHAERCWMESAWPNTTAVWAPEWIWVEARSSCLIFWSSETDGRPAEGPTGDNLRISVRGRPTFKRLSRRRPSSSIQDTPSSTRTSFKYRRALMATVVTAHNRCSSTSFSRMSAATIWLVARTQQHWRQLLPPGEMPAAAAQQMRRCARCVQDGSRHGTASTARAAALRAAASSRAQIQTRGTTRGASRTLPPLHDHRTRSSATRGPVGALTAVTTWSRSARRSRPSSAKGPRWCARRGRRAPGSCTTTVSKPRTMASQRATMGWGPGLCSRIVRRGQRGRATHQESVSHLGYATVRSLKWRVRS